MLLLHRAFLLGCLASAAIAQAYIVDAANGPGTHFTDIATAVATVPDGSVLEVRSGNYASFTIANKGLSVLFASGAMVSGTNNLVDVTGTSPQQTVLIQGLRTNGGTSARLSLTSCQGLVLLDRCSAASGTSGQQLHLQASQCTWVHAVGCSFGGSQINSPIGATLDNCTVVFSGCSIVSGGASGMRIVASQVQLLDCGVAVMQGYPSGPAISMAGGDVRMVGGSCYTILNFSIAGTGVARIDPSVTLAGGFLGVIASTIQGSIVEMPAVTATSGPLGGAVTATMRGPAGQVGALLVGLPGVPWPYAGIVDPIWLQPGSEGVCAFTVFAAGTPLQVTYAVPNVPAMRGMRFCWQGVSYGTTSGLQASNPAITTHW